MTSETFAIIYAIGALFMAAFVFTVAYFHARDYEFLVVVVSTVGMALLWPLTIVFFAIEYLNDKWWQR